MNLTTAIGVLAACCTTASYIPQLKKCWHTGKAEDISLKMYLILACGLTLWVVYGVLISDFVIITANVIGLVLLFGILYFRIRSG